MTWAIYTKLTSQSRALESLTALFAIFWASVVARYAFVGLEPLKWAGVVGSDQFIAPAVLAFAGALHMTGTVLVIRMPWAAILRCLGMIIMAGTFGWLARQGVGISAAPTYFAFCCACVGAALNAAKDIRYAEVIHA